MATGKRLIDANALIAFIERTCCKGCKSDEGVKCRSCEHDDAMAMIEDAPTVDAVEVVRCAKCKHSQMCEDGTVLCKLHSEYGERNERSGAYSVWMEPDDFCSYGERIDNG